MGALCQKDNSYETQNLARAKYINRNLGCLGFYEAFDHFHGNVEVTKQH